MNTIDGMDTIEHVPSMSHVRGGIESRDCCGLTDSATIPCNGVYQMVLWTKNALALKSVD